MGKKYSVTVDGVTHIVEVSEVGSGNVTANVVNTNTNVQPSVSEPVAPAENNTNTSKAPVGENTVVAPLQGTLQEIKVSVGDTVKAGDVLLIIEAMKMENEVVAPFDGKVSAIHKTKGVKVDAGEALIDLG